MGTYTTVQISFPCWKYDNIADIAKKYLLEIKKSGLAKDFLQDLAHRSGFCDGIFHWEKRSLGYRRGVC